MEAPNTVGTRLSIASGTKGLTALTVLSLVEHLLASRSGIGDYIDEDYKNSGYVVLTLLAERATGVPFAEPGVGEHAHGALQHHGRRLADRPAPPPATHA